MGVCRVRDSSACGPRKDGPNRDDFGAQRAVQDAASGALEGARPGRPQWCLPHRSDRDRARRTRIRLRLRADPRPSLRRRRDAVEKRRKVYLHLSPDTFHPGHLTPSTWRAPRDDRTRKSRCTSALAVEERDPAPSSNPLPAVSRKNLNGSVRRWAPVLLDLPAVRRPTVLICPLGGPEIVRRKGKESLRWRCRGGLSPRHDASTEVSWRRG